MTKNLSFREKDRIVLSAIVENYLKSGKPISSGFIFQKKVVVDSPATIRNIMFKLEELGFLSQPHASSGRVPTDKGLRFYVNSLLEEVPQSTGQLAIIDQVISGKRGDLNALLQRTSRLLADHSDSLGFVLSPRISRTHFHHLRFIKIAEGKVMIILVSSFNMVLTEIVTADVGFDQMELDRASHYINQNFRGKNLLFIRDFLLAELPKYKTKFESAFNKLMALLRASILPDAEESQIILQGASKLLDKFGLSHIDQLKSLFENFEEKAHLAKLLSDVIALDRVKVLIGSESNLPLISDCSLVLSHYGDDSQVLGTLGIIGPKRIPYKKIIPLVDNVAKKLTRTISENQ